MKENKSTEQSKDSSKDSWFELRIRLQPADVISRIAANADSEVVAFSLSGYQGEKPFLCQIKGSQLRIQKRRFHRNGFQPYLFATIEPTSYGTRIIGHFRIRALTRLLMTLWFVAAAIYGSVFIMMTWRQAHLANDLLWTLHSIALFLFGGLIVVVGKLLARNDRGQIAQWLRAQFSDSIV